MLADALQEAQLLSHGRQVLDGPEWRDREVESSGELKSSDISFD
jgi:hypothetical protein